MFQEKYLGEINTVYKITRMEEDHEPQVQKMSLILKHFYLELDYPTVLQKWDSFMYWME